jgi:hypothetical protein
VDNFHLLGVGRYVAAAHHVSKRSICQRKSRRRAGRDIIANIPLWNLPGVLHSQLDLPSKYGKKLATSLVGILVWVSAGLVVFTILSNVSFSLIDLPLHKEEVMHATAVLTDNLYLCLLFSCQHCSLISVGAKQQYVLLVARTRQNWRLLSWKMNQITRLRLVPRNRVLAQTPWKRELGTDYLLHVCPILFFLRSSF